jgi:hypothetical protein
VTREKLRSEVHRIIAQKNKIAPDQQLAFIKAEVTKFEDETDRDIAETLVFGVADAVQVDEIMSSREERREIRSFYAGLALLALGIVLAFFSGNRELNRVQMFLVQTLIALGAAAVGASIPGFLAINGVIKDKAGYHKMTYKATGGLAIFIIVFLWLPSLLR